MSMADPFLPAHSSDDEHIPAAEPGESGPEPQAPEEPDVFEAADEDPTAEGVEVAHRETHFVTPTPGERLHPEDLQD